MADKLFQILKMKHDLMEIFRAGLAALRPPVLIRNRIKVSGTNLLIDTKNYDIGKNVYLIGFGKAVLGMSLEMETLLGKSLTRGIVSIPRGSLSHSKAPDNSVVPSPVDYIENSKNNQPDEDTLKATQEIMNLASSLDEQDTLIVLISGGGSALLSMPYPWMTLPEKNEFWGKLQNSGADIQEVNIVRQRLSMVKGGRLAELAYPATVFSFILSDIIGDPIELIASGPTCHLSTEPSQFSKILKKYGITPNDNINKLLESNESPSKNHFARVNNFVIGNNSCAIDAAREEALSRGLRAIVLFNDVQGLVQGVSKMYVKLAKLFCALSGNSMTKDEFVTSMKNCSDLKSLESKVDAIFSHLEGDFWKRNEGLVLIAGGEPSVVVRGTGKGGRNQELALQFSHDWAEEVGDNSALEKFDVVLLSAGTDGQDGPTDAAGAFGYAAVANDVTIEDHQKQLFLYRPRHIHHLMM